MHNLQGSLVRLTRPEPSDANLIASLRSSPRVRRWFVDDRPIDHFRNREWLITEAVSDTSGLFVIRSLVDSSFLGFVGWSDHDSASGTVQLGRIAVHPGSYKALSRAIGYAPRLADECGRLLIEFAFTVLAADRIYVEVLPDNHAAIGLVERLGLERVSIQLRSRPNGHLSPVQVFQLQRSEWTASE